MLGRPEIAMGSRGHIGVPGARGVAKGTGGARRGGGHYGCGGCGVDEKAVA